MEREIVLVPVPLAHKDHCLNQIDTCFTLENLFSKLTFFKKNEFFRKLLEYQTG